MKERKKGGKGGRKEGREEGRKEGREGGYLCVGLSVLHEVGSSY